MNKKSPNPNEYSNQSFVFNQFKDKHLVLKHIFNQVENGANTHPQNQEL